MVTTTQAAQIDHIGSRPIRSGRAWLSGLTYLFVFSVCFTAWIPLSVNIGGLNLRASQILLPVTIALLWAQKPFTTLSRRSLVLVLAGALWWGASLFWTVLSDSAGSSVKPLGRVFLLGLNLLHVVAIHLLVVRTGRLRETLTSFLFSVTLLNGALVLVTGAATFGLPIPKVFLMEEFAPMLMDGQVVGGTVLRFVFGGVIAGCVSAAALVIAVCLSLDRSDVRPRGLWASAIMAGVGLIVGFSRQGVVSLVAGLAIVVLYLVLRRQVSRLVKVAVLAVLVSLVAFVIMSALPGGRSFIQAFTGRIALLFQAKAYTSGTVYGRTAMWSGMWKDIARNPFLGNGQDAYLEYMLNAWEEGSHNFPLEVLHTTGIWGLIPYIVMHAAVALSAWRMLKRHAVPDITRWHLLGLVGAYGAVTTASLTNLIFWNPTYWLVMGMLSAATSLAEKDSRSQGEKGGRN